MAEKRYSPVGALLFPLKLEDSNTVPITVDDPAKLLATFFDHPVEFKGSDARPA